MVEIYQCIGSITLEHVSALPKADMNSTAPSRQRHAVFRSLLSDNIKQDSAITTAHCKHSISFLKEKKYWQHHLVQYGKTLMVVMNNIDMPLHCTLCQLCIRVTPL